MLPYVIAKPEHISAIHKDIRELESLVRGLDPQSLTVHYDLNARQMLHAFKALDTVLSLGMRAFVPPAIDAIMPPFFDLLAACVEQLRHTDWTELVAEMQRCRGTLCRPGVVHPPLIWPPAQHADAALNPAVLRMSGACCHAELLLLLLRAGLCLSFDGTQKNSLLKELMQGRWREFDVNTIWPPLLSAMHALLGGVQPQFQAWPNAVDMVQDAHVVRSFALPLAILHRCIKAGVSP